MNKITSGIPGLDEMLDGGFIKGKSFLIVGTAGTGKTTFGAQFLRGGTENGENGIFLTLEQDKKSLVSDLKSSGIELGNRVTVFGGAISDIMHYKNQTGAKLDDFLDEIEEVIKSKRAKRVVIDSINLFLLMFDTEEKKRDALLRITRKLSELGCTSLLTSESRDVDPEGAKFGFEEFVVDGVVHLHNYRKDAYVKNALNVKKMRGSSHHKNIVLYKITDKGILVFPEDHVVRG